MTPYPAEVVVGAGEHQSMQSVQSSKDEDVGERKVDVEEKHCVWDRSPTHPSRPATCSCIRLLQYDERYQET
jgi:hypothetical protein